LIDSVVGHLTPKSELEGDMDDSGVGVPRPGRISRAACPQADRDRSAVPLMMIFINQIGWIDRRVFGSS